MLASIPQPVARMLLRRRMATHPMSRCSLRALRCQVNWSDGRR